MCVAGAIYVSQSLSFKAPIYVGEKVTAKVEVTAIHPSKPFVTFTTKCLNIKGPDPTTPARGALDFFTDAVLVVGVPRLQVECALTARRWCTFPTNTRTGTRARAMTTSEKNERPPRAAPNAAARAKHKRGRSNREYILLLLPLPCGWFGPLGVVRGRNAGATSDDGLHRRVARRHVPLERPVVRSQSQKSQQRPAAEEEGEGEGDDDEANAETKERRTCIRPSSGGLLSA